IIFAFLFGLMALIAAPSLQAETRGDDYGLAQASAAGTSENEPDFPASLSSTPSSASPGSPTLDLPPKGRGALESAHRSCKIERKEFFSDVCAAQMTYYAFVPQESEEAVRYPVLYLLHGAFDGYTAWKDHAENIICELVSKYRIIIVTPEGLSFG